ncbi:transcriptional regulator, LuxR family protein [Verrucomicrobiia bacterium DG1235]|nr:transcriptional regulator, LuxR family protein [Verrucomicrobiae bacterium DG1235]
MILASPPKQILYIDEHPVCHAGLDCLLENNPSFSVCYTARNTDSASLPSDADLVILEITSAHPRGIPAVRDLKQIYRDVPVLVLSCHHESIYADRCLKAGASGFIMKSAPLEDLVLAIETVTEGGLYVSEDVKSLMINRLANPSMNEVSGGFHNLSDRELLIVEQIGLSKNNKEIADALQISVKTIESHRSRIKAKLRLDSPQDLMRYAMRIHYF